MDEIIIREAEYWCALNNVDIENIDDEDLYQCITSIANVYTVDGKYYNLLYVKNLYDDSEIWQEPYEVYPVEETITMTRYYAKER